MASATDAHGPAGGRPRFERFADAFGRLAVVSALLGLIAALVLTAVPAVLGLARGSDDRATTYHPLRPAKPMRVSIGEDRAPVVASDDDPARSLAGSPVDAPLVTWWTGSAKPGAGRGQTVLTAHAKGRQGGLTAIGSLHAGDSVDVLTERGTMRYRVSGVRSYDETAFARLSPRLYAQGGGHGRLEMVSAQEWDGVDYQEFVVLTGTPLGEPD